MSSERVRLVRPKIETSRTRAVAGDNSRSRIYVAEQIELIPIARVNLSDTALRNHQKSTISHLAKAYEEYGVLVPMVVDQNNVIRSGVLRFRAAQKAKLKCVPVVRVQHLSDAKLRAYQVFDNKLAEAGRWDFGKLAIELKALSTLLPKEGLDISLTGFAVGEVDRIVIDHEHKGTDPSDTIEIDPRSPVSRRGDVWKLHHHRVSCDDAREVEAVRRLLNGRKADMAMLDPPYNLRVKQIVGRGAVKHEEFAMASGELSSGKFVEFLTPCFQAAASNSRDGSIHYVFMDWRHLPELFAAGQGPYAELINLAVWVKTNAGQGSFYRSQHEHVAIYRVGNAQHLNNVQLGKFGRSRSNVWTYAGVNSFRAGRMDDLKAHPTVKPVTLVCDAIKDCTRRGDVVVDTFSGSGTTLLAAERTGRHAAVMDIEPKYVDLTIQRWQQFTGRDAVHERTGLTFEEMAVKRGGKNA